MGATHTVIAVTGDTVEIWDGRSRIEPDHPEKSTDIVTIEGPNIFQVGDRVTYFLRLVERPEKTDGDT